MKERKKLIFPGLCREPIKPLNRACTTHEDTGCPLEELLEAQAGEWARRVSTLQRISWRERERETWGPKPLVEEGCFHDLSVSICRLLYKKFLSTMIKIRKPNIQQPLPREQGINNGHKVRRQPISQERGSRLSSFVVRRIFTEGDSSLSHPMPSVLGVACTPLVSVARNWQDTEDLWETACRNPPVKQSLTITDEPMFSHHSHPKYLAYLRVHSRACTFSGFGQMENVMYPTL